MKKDVQSNFKDKKLQLVLNNEKNVMIHKTSSYLIKLYLPPTKSKKLLLLQSMKMVIKWKTLKKQHVSELTQLLKV